MRKFVDADRIANSQREARMADCAFRGGALDFVNKHCPRLCSVLAALVLLVSAAGCGYTTNGMYSNCFRTINVPIFKNETMRRDIEFIMTEKVIQRIETRTPYKVVTGATADTELRGTITSFSKAPFGEDGFDNPRGGNLLIVLNLSWIDNRTGKVIQQSSQRFDLRGQQPFVIDLAQSSATAVDDLADRISNHVVSLLQEPW